MSDSDSDDNFGASWNDPLFAAARRGHADTVRALIQRQGADPNCRWPFDGATPMYWAARNNHVEVVRVLGELGADPDLGRFGDSETPIYTAAWRGHLEVVRALGELGADPNRRRTDDGTTPLFYAAWNIHVEVVRVLGEFGADPNIPSFSDKTPILKTAFFGSVEGVRALLELGADPKLASVAMAAKGRRFNRKVQHMLNTSVPQPHREQIRAELDDKIEEVQIIEMVADFVGPMCDPKRRKAYINCCGLRRRLLSHRQ
jgi:ankyrin repeat protein